MDIQEFRGSLVQYFTRRDLSKNAKIGAIASYCTIITPILVGLTLAITAGISAWKGRKVSDQTGEKTKTGLLGVNKLGPSTSTSQVKGKELLSHLNIQEGSQMPQVRLTNAPKTFMVEKGGEEFEIKANDECFGRVKEQGDGTISLDVSRKKIATLSEEKDIYYTAEQTKKAMGWGQISRSEEHFEKMEDARDIDPSPGPYAVVPGIKGTHVKYEAKENTGDETIEAGNLVQAAIHVPLPKGLTYNHADFPPGTIFKEGGFEIPLDRYKIIYNCSETGEYHLLVQDPREGETRPGYSITVGPQEISSEKNSLTDF